MDNLNETFLGFSITCFVALAAMALGARITDIGGECIFRALQSL